MADRLATYRKKRDFSRTPEPEGGQSGGAGKGLRYTIQKHDARRLHFDLRLEHDGALLSWAITKGPSLTPGDKRLAVRTEDHPLDYATFEGVIPDGYGAGTVMLWDEGTWEPKDDPEEGLEKGRLRFDLHGQRLTGGWTLARMDKEDAKENWLLMKRKDPAAANTDPTRRWTESVASGRTLKEIADKADAGRRADAPPRFVKPMLATLVEAPPSGDRWLHEIKHDGYRLIAVVQQGKARLYTRNGQDWTDKFAGLAQAFEALEVADAVLDGEVVAAGKTGAPDFSTLQARLKSGGKIEAILFDCLHLDGEDLTGLPLEERRARLADLLGGRQGPLRFGQSIAADGAEVLQEACKLGAEGVVSKRIDGRYRSGRSKGWLKSKCDQRCEAVIGGYRTSDKAGRPFASLLLGTHEDGKLIYRGRVGTGFDGDTLDRLAAKLDARTRKTPPFEDLPSEARHGAVWCTPDLVAQIRYTEMTEDGHFRHPRFLGEREDKSASQVSRDRAEPAPAAAKTPKLTNRDKILYPDAGLTKGALADYLAAVAEPMLRYLGGRPLTLVRCPDGREECFFQKRPGKGMPDAIRQWRKQDDVRMVVEEAAGLAGAAQMGALELHIGGARVADPNKPERLVFDLDPGPGIAFPRIREAAREVADLIEAAGLTPFPLLTGGKGVHVVVPLDPAADWGEAKRFARALAHGLARAKPDWYVASASKAKRQKRIFVDWLRNGDGATAIAPFSPRARPGAPVATPLDWHSLRHCSGADIYDLMRMRRRLASLKSDPWAGYEEARRPLSPDLADALTRML